MPDTTVAIVGAGIGGVYLAAEFGMLGCKLRLHDFDDSRLADIRARGGVDVAEMDNYPYSCWRLGPARIRPIVRKRWLQIASFPGNRIASVFALLSPLFPAA